MKLCWHCWHIDDESIERITHKAFCRKNEDVLDHYEYTKTCCRCGKTVNKKASRFWSYPSLAACRKIIEIERGKISTVKHN